jgi:hypothetical protein
MEAVREVTVWQGITRQPNHDYLLDGDRVLAYRKWGQGPVLTLSGRMKIDRRGRKFERLEPSPFDLAQPSHSKEVEGSGGKIYIVDTEAQTCTCPGFTFRGTCKHIKALVDKG